MEANDYRFPTFKKSFFFFRPTEKKKKVKKTQFSTLGDNLPLTFYLFIYFEKH